MNDLILKFILILMGCMAFNVIIIRSNKLGKLIKSIFYVPSPKSTTGAVLLGGLPVAIGSCIVFYLFSANISSFLGWLLPAIILVSIGYLDDKVEIKPFVKLGLQVIAVFTFAFFAAGGEQINFVLFAVYIVWGFGVLSGSNLLDGIDTYSVKYSIGSYAAFALLGLYFGHTQIVLISALLVAPILAFYFFNRFPSKMHLGEIGGTIIGLNCLHLSSLIYSGEGRAIAEFSAINIELLVLSLSVMHLPMTELGISLLRRIATAKSPFHGDRLHLHYLFASQKKIGVTKAANILSSLHIQALVINLVVSVLVNPLAAFFVSGIFYVAYYIFFGFEAWSKDYTSRREVPILEIKAVTTLSDLMSKLVHPSIVMDSNSNYKNRVFERKDHLNKAYDPGGGRASPEEQVPAKYNYPIAA